MLGVMTHRAHDKNPTSLVWWGHPCGCNHFWYPDDDEQLVGPTLIEEERLAHSDIRSWRIPLILQAVPATGVCCLVWFLVKQPSFLLLNR